MLAARENALALARRNLEHEESKGLPVAVDIEKFRKEVEQKVNPLTRLPCSLDERLIFTLTSTTYLDIFENLNMLFSYSRLLSFLLEVENCTRFD